MFDSIGSIELRFKDPMSKPGEVMSCIFGTMEQGAQLKCSLEVPAEEEITGIRIRHNPTACQIQNITFDTDDATEIEFNGKQCNGSWKQFILEPGQRVVGCYGTLENDKITSLGFVIWTPSTSE